MTDQPDWADDVAREMCEGDYTEAIMAMLASALRTAFKRGEVAGMRRAAEIASVFPASYDDGVSLHAENMTAARIVIDIRSQADQIEQGL